jgi:two-component system OmpR family response regulator
VRILLVGEDNQLCKKVSSRLSESNYQIDIAENLKDAEYYIDIRNYDLILVDASSTKNNGLDLLNDVKQKFSRVFFILISDNEDKDSELNAFKAGTDDYIKKPFDFDVLIARIEARLRFGGTNVIKIDDLLINPDEEKITYKGKEIELKGKPFEVLTHLARHRVQIVSKEQLLDAIWEEPELVTPNVIEVAINQIRQKMDKPLNISTIETIRRRGYRFCYPKSD